MKEFIVEFTSSLVSIILSSILNLNFNNISLNFSYSGSNGSIFTSSVWGVSVNRLSVKGGISSVVGTGGISSVVGTGAISPVGGTGAISPVGGTVGSVDCIGREVGLGISGLVTLQIEECLLFELSLKFNIKYESELGNESYLHFAWKSNLPNKLEQLGFSIPINFILGRSPLIEDCNKNNIERILNIFSF